MALHQSQSALDESLVKVWAKVGISYSFWQNSPPTIYYTDCFVYAFVSKLKTFAVAKLQWLNVDYRQ